MRLLSLSLVFESTWSLVFTVFWRPSTRGSTQQEEGGIVRPMGGNTLPVVADASKTRKTLPPSTAYFDTEPEALSPHPCRNDMGHVPGLNATYDTLVNSWVHVELPALLIRMAELFRQVGQGKTSQFR
jgi:hypothetical protein